MPASVVNALNVAIVFCLIFFLMSTMASHITELISAFFNSRGRTLCQQLAAALTKPVADEILADPVIRTFARASRGSAGAAPATSSTTAMPSYITSASFTRAVARSFATGEKSGGSDVLRELMDDAQQRSVAFETTVAEWYAQFNDRTTGVYKRDATVKLFAVGFVGAFLLDIDTVRIAEYLWANPAIASGTVDRINSVFAAIGDSTSAPDVKALTKHGADLAKALTVSSGAGAFGWQELVPVQSFSGVKWWATKILGWMLAAVATSFGAQFWFQLFSDGLKVRLVGKHPDAPLPGGDDGKADVIGVTVEHTGEATGGALAVFVAPPALPPPLLGSLSSKYEVGNRGPATVSSGVGDPGGASYGSYQMTSLPAGGTVTNFVAQLPAAQRDGFARLTAGSAAFSSAWEQLAKADSAGFFTQQHAYIRSTHYEPLCASVSVMVAIARRSFALQNVAWSTAVQHGAHTSILSSVCKGFDFHNYKGTAAELDGLVIKAIYAERGRKMPDGRLAYFTKCSAKVQASVAQRFVSEQKDALQMLANDAQPSGALAQADEYAL